MSDDVEVITKWWNGQWQYRLQLFEPSRGIRRVRIDIRGHGGSWTPIWSQYDSSEGLERIRKDEDMEREL